MNRRTNMTYEEFKSIMHTNFQGMDPWYDTYYWNLWQDSLAYGCKNPAAKPDFEDFLEAIATETI